MDSNFNISLSKGINVSYSSGNYLNLVKQNGLNILYFNGRSIKNKLNEIELFLSCLQGIVHVIVITETWLDEENYLFYNINGYTSYHSIRPKYAGGVAIFCHNSIQTCLSLNEIFLENSHCLVVKICNFNIHIGTIYRAPEGDLDSFIDYYSRKLNSFKNIIYIGDYNINILNDSLNRVSKFKDTVESDGYVILNSESCDMATRVTDQTKSIIDLVVTDLLKYKYILDIDDLTFSDHKLIFLNIDFEMTVSPKILKSDIRTDYSGIKKDIKTSDFSEIKSVNELIELLKTINSKNQKHLKKPITFTKYKQMWSSEKLNLIIKERKQFWDLKKKYPTNNFYSSRYRELQKLIEIMSKSDKKSYYGNKFECSLHNPRHTWKVINELIYNKTTESKSVLPKELCVNGVAYSEATDICDIFNDFFVNIGSNLADSNQSTFTSQTTSTQENASQNNCIHEFPPVTEPEIINIIKSLNSNAAAGYDEISSKVVKNSAKELAPILVQLINECFRTGSFPDLLKIARVLPIFKEGNSNDPGNYRPISILPILSKIYEMVIRNRMMLYLEKINFINKDQYGFQRNANTTAACLNLIEEIYKNIEQKHKTCSVFIDVRKAFDSVDHVMLIRKLEEIGFKDKTIDIFKSYLFNRKQFVMIGDDVSSERVIKTGVPQGSILGPLLFIIFVNDLFDCSFHGALQLYADDATLTYGESSYDSLKEKISDDIMKFNSWMINNKLSLNFNKTNFIIYHLRNTDTQNIFNEVCFANHKIDRVEKTKYLGMIINESLNWNDHVDLVKKKVARFVGVLRRMSYLLDEKIKKQIYFAYIHSHVIYVNPIWSSVADYKLQELQVLQNKAMKAVYNLPRLTPSKELYIGDRGGILPIKVLTEYELNLLSFKINFKLIKSKFTFKITKDVHSYKTRIANNFRSIFSRTNCTKNSIFNRGVSLFNKLPEIVKNEKTIAVFKNSLKKYYSVQLSKP